MLKRLTKNFGLWLGATVLLPMSVAMAASEPHRILETRFKAHRLAYDWNARHDAMPDCCDAAGAFNLHSWSADSRFVVGYSSYTGGSPIDTFNSLYAVNLPARAVYRLFSTGRGGMLDPGLVWSWNGTGTEIACQVRGPDLGYYVWNLTNLHYRYRPGPILPGARLENLDHADHLRYLFRIEDEQRFRQSLDAPDAPLESLADSADYGPNLASERQQQAYETPLRRSGYRQQVRLCAPQGAGCWEQAFEAAYTVAMSPQPPYLIFAAWIQGQRLLLSLTPLNQTAPRLTAELAWSAERLPELYAFWHGRQLVLLADRLYAVETVSLQSHGLENLADRHLTGVLPSPDGKAFAFSSFAEGEFGDRLEIWGWSQAEEGLTQRPER